MAFLPKVAIAILTGFLAFLVTPATGADISTDAPDGCVLSLSGDIAPGDTAALQAVFDNPDFYAPDRAFLCLDSTGGSFHEALRLADMISSRYLGTAVPKGASCLAECAIIFMFGQGSGEHWVGTNRKMHHSARLGFRRPFIAVPAEMQYTAGQMQLHQDAAYDNMALLMNTLLRQDTHDFPTSLMANMLGHAGDDLYMIDTAHKAFWWNIPVDGWTPPAQVSAQTVAAACQIVADVILDGDGMYKPFDEEPYGADLQGPKSIHGETVYLSTGGWLWEGSFSCRVGHSQDTGDLSVCFGQYETIEDEDWSAMCRSSNLLTVATDLKLADLP